MTKVFSIANQKGGVGKTTTTVNLGAGLARLGIPTLIVDLDPQANATSALGIEKTEGKSLYKVLHGEANAADMIVATTTKHLELIPSENDLATIESELAQAENYLGRLREALTPILAAGKYRAVLIDCPPSLGILSLNALGASDHLIVTLQTEYLALEGLAQIMEVVDRLKAAGGSDKLTVGAIVMTMHDSRTKHSRAVVDDAKTHYPALVMDAMIPRSVRLSECPSHGQTIFQFDARSRSPGTIAYEALAKEFAKRFALK